MLMDKIKMSEFNQTSPSASTTNLGAFGDAKQSSLFSANTQGKSRQQTIINSGSSSSMKETSTTQQMTNTTKTFSSQRLQSVKHDINDLKASMAEIKGNFLAPSNNTDITDMSELKRFEKKMRSSLENLVDGNNEPLITYPDGDSPTDDLQISLNSNLPTVPVEAIRKQSGLGTFTESVKFEENKMASASKKTVVTNGIKTEQATSNQSQSKRLQARDIDYKEDKAMSAMRNKVEMDGLTAEKQAALVKESRSFKTGDIQQQESNNAAMMSTKLKSNQISAENNSIAVQQQHSLTAGGIKHHEQHITSSSQSNVTITRNISSTGSSHISASQYNTIMNGLRFENDDELFTEMESLCSNSNQQDVEVAIRKAECTLNDFVKVLQEKDKTKPSPDVLEKINTIMTKAWAVPTHGHNLGYTLCNTLRKSGGLDLLVKGCTENDKEIQFSSARLLEQCLTTENRTHVVETGLEEVVNVACVCTKNTKHQSIDHSRVGTGILEHLFKHSEGTCSDVIRLGGLDAVLFECRKNDVETLRHCAGALANLSLYGGADNQEAMIRSKVPMWLFPLAFHNDDNIKYYACLAIAVLVANKEIEAAVLKSGTLDLVEPFVTTHDPSEFAKSNLAHAHGQSKHWLQRLVPVLSSKREEARNLAAFHFCMEAGIKKEQGKTEIFHDIGAIEPLKKVASCPNAIASKFAAQALRLIGEQVPHKLSQQVPLWSVDDVKEWVKQIGFGEYETTFVESKVDGDLLLQLTEDNLKEDIGIKNGLQRARFWRELMNLKKMADYSSRDVANLNNFLLSIEPEYCIYTYSMLNAGVDKESLKNLTDSQLINECGIKNSIHRLRILNAIKNNENSLALSTEDNSDKPLDVFVSYRRSNGSQLASLLKVHLELRGFTVFIDVERLEAGKFDNNLLNSIRQAKHFILVLTPQALERCLEDHECKDWVHREIVTALNSCCNIIPIIDNFQWPEAERLPEDMRSVCHFNGVRWIHDYQDACVDKLERFMRGEGNIQRMFGRSEGTPNTPSTASTIRSHPPNYQRMHSNESDNNSYAAKAMTPNSKHKFVKSTQPNSPWSPVASRASKHSQRVLAPYRNRPCSGNQQNTRRSSAAGITHPRPPLPPVIGNRSQSLDGLLTEVDNAIEFDNSQHDETPSEPIMKSNSKALLALSRSGSQRRAKSCEDLLDDNSPDNESRREQTFSDSIKRSERTNGFKDFMDNNLSITKSLRESTKSPGESTTSSYSSLNTDSSLNQEKPSEMMMFGNPVRADNDNVDSLSINDHPNEDTISQNTNYSRQDSTTSKDSDKKKNKINRYVKKMKSFMKK